ncbi:MAG: hypothetical protein RL648_1027 [Verrucomicrobiota bacterium]
MRWQPSRAAALDQLQVFVPRAREYAAGRNFDLPGRQAVSQLSPFLRYRLLTEREVVEAVLSEHPYEKVSKFVEEVCWRTYWKGYLEMRPEFWRRYRMDSDQICSGALMDPGLEDRLRQARLGATGIDCFDAWVRELVETGWLHNHARMWFASIWIFTLDLPWQAGAAFFLEHLLDGDAASNTLSWRWVGGLHTPGKQYLARADNIEKFTGGRYFPRGELSEAADPLPLDGAVSPQPLPAVSTLRDMAFPSLSSCPAGLLVFPDDLFAEGSELKETPFCSICLLDGRDIQARNAHSPLVKAFHQGAMLDAANRLKEHWNAQIVPCERSVTETIGKASPENVGRSEKMRLYHGQVDCWVEGVLTWIRNENLKSIWLLRPSIGPWSEAFDDLAEALRSRPVQIQAYRRKWDALHWPHASHGYFRFKQDLEGRLDRFLNRPRQTDLF